MAYYFQDILHKQRAIGDIHHVFVDFGMGFFHTVPETHRVFDPNLGGSAQLDIGPYTLLWVGLLLAYLQYYVSAEPSRG